MTQVDELLLEHFNDVEHSGTKGMKWGVRKQKRIAKQTRRTQSRIDQTRRVASGRGFKGEKFVQAAFRVPVADLVLGKGVVGGSQRLLDRHAKIKTRIESGHGKTREILGNAVGLRYRDLNFSYSK